MNRLRTAVYWAALGLIAVTARVPRAVLYGLIALAILVSACGLAVAVVAALIGGAR